MKTVKKMGTIVTTILVTCSLGGAVSNVHADTYYGNGVYCNKHTCHVDWGKAWGNIVNNSSVNWLTGGQAGWKS